MVGQMGHEASIPSLIARLRDSTETGMVRHEAAEALGSLASRECRFALEEFAGDGVDVVRESVEVGLDMVEYGESGEFQYADVPCGL
jgi:deoxyhypusine monooxygenase